MRYTLIGSVYLPTGEVWTKNPANDRLSMLRKCLHCQTEFYADTANVKKGMGFYCCRICMRRGNGNKPMQDRECKHCGKTFKEFFSRIEDGRGEYCSKKCYSKSMQVDEVDMICEECGVVFKGLPWRKNRVDTGYYQRLFCSQACYHKARATGLIVKCANPTCENEFYKQKKIVERNSRRFCSIKCSSEVICGTDHHRWKDDKIGREDKEFTSVQRRMIFERYNHRCAVTGLHRDEASLHLHHIVPISEGGLNTVDNGIPLWIEVHKKAHREIFDLKPYILSDLTDESVGEGIVQGTLF